MILDSISPIANHLWQSTLFAGMAGVLTLALQKNSARVRHWVWVAASLKFLVPFSVLVAIGSRIEWRTAPAIAANVSVVVEQASEPFGIMALPPQAATGAGNPLPLILVGIWACGVVGISISWLVRWQRIRRAVQSGSRVELDLPIRAISSPSFLAPGVFGVFRPLLLLPQGILEQLTPVQWKSVLTHELCHVRRRDNLIGAVQMFIEMLFWFHPLVWWIGKRILEERERACDEEVLRLGCEPRAYAQSILKVCKLYLASPLPCAAGVSGANLRMRIEAILHERIVKNLNGGTKALLAATGCFAAGLPIAIGLLHGVSLRAQTVPATLRFEVASVKTWVPDPKTGGIRTAGVPGPGNHDPGRFTARTNLLSLIVLAYDIPLYRLSEQKDLYDQRFEIEAKMPADTTREQFDVMLQNLLADRLGLKVHWATQQIETYTLVVAKGGPKLKPAAPDSAPANEASTDSRSTDKVGSDGFPIPPPGNAAWVGAAPGGKIGMRGHNQTIAELVRAIGPRTLDGPLTDATGLTGKYDYTVFWSMAATTAALNPTAAVEPDGPSIFDAVEEQLGLKIEKRKGPVQMLVVDHVEKKPTEN